MKYIMLLYGNNVEMPNMTPEQVKTMQQEWFTFNAEAKAAGVLVDFDGLAPGDATTIRVRDGKTLIADGPFAETHEQLGGFYIIDCADIDEAINWGAKIPTAMWGSIQIHPLFRGQMAAKRGE